MSSVQYAPGQEYVVPRPRYLHLGERQPSFEFNETLVGWLSDNASKENCQIEHSLEFQSYVGFTRSLNNGRLADGKKSRYSQLNNNQRLALNTEYNLWAPGYTPDGRTASANGRVMEILGTKYADKIWTEKTRAPFGKNKWKNDGLSFNNYDDVPRIMTELRRAASVFTYMSDRRVQDGFKQASTAIAVTLQEFDRVHQLSKKSESQMSERWTEFMSTELESITSRCSAWFRKQFAALNDSSRHWNATPGQIQQTKDALAQLESQILGIVQRTARLLDT